MAKDRRLIKRYFSTNPVFLLRFAWDFLQIRLLKRGPAAT
jgi:N-acetylglucosaminyldiphosphoundecaprenol N-acetyl-beta-D-mannosaminyltransferase